MSSTDDETSERRLGQPYKRARLADAYDVIVIGSGPGALSAAATLSLCAGKRVLALERHYTPGGYTHTFRRGQYEWDIGCHYLGNDVGIAGSEVSNIFAHLTAGRLQWQKLPEVYDRIALGDKTYDFVAGEKNFIEAMCTHFPHERAAVQRYLELVHASVRARFLYMGSKIIPRFADALAGPLLRHAYLRLASKTTSEVLDTITNNAALKSVLTAAWLDYGLPPGQSSFATHATLVDSFLNGAWYPVGGGSAFAASMIPMIESTGGTVVVRADVTQIMVKGRTAVGVRLADGREIHAPLVISDAGAVSTFAALLPPEATAGNAYIKRVLDLGGSSAHCMLYAGLKDYRPTLFDDVGNLVILPSGDHDTTYRNALNDPQSAFKCLFVSCPSTRDPAYPAAHGGRHVVQLSTPGSLKWFESWADSRWGHRGADYTQMKEAFAEQVLTNVAPWLPDLRDHIERWEVSTPLSTRHFANHPNGEIYGLTQTPARYTSVTLGARTPIKNLYLTGADVVTSGIIGAVFSGVVTASCITGRNYVTLLGRSPSRRKVASRRPSNVEKTDAHTPTLHR